VSIQSLNAERLAPLFPPLIKKANEFIAQCKKAGVTILITQGLRTWAKQNEYYAQGRTTPGKIVTNAKGGESYHNFGLAFDIVPIGGDGKPIWDTDHQAWQIAMDIGGLHPGHSKSRLDPQLVAEIVAADLQIDLNWGGDWKSFKDLPHFELTAGTPLQLLRTLYKPDLQRCWAEVQARL